MVGFILFYIKVCIIKTVFLLANSCYVSPICFSYVSMAQCKTCLFYKLQWVNEQNNDHKTSLDHVLPCQFVSGHIDVFGYYMVGCYAVVFSAL